MARYYVKTKFVFSGVFEVEAFNREEAKELILKECGLVMGGDIHTTLPDGEVRWNFDTHRFDKLIKIIEKHIESYNLCCLPVSTLLVAIPFLTKRESRAVKSSGVDSG